MHSDVFEWEPGILPVLPAGMSCGTGAAADPPCWDGWEALAVGFWELWEVSGQLWKVNGAMRKAGAIGTLHRRCVLGLD